MSQSQQEAYQIIFKNTPQKLYQVVRMLSMMKQFAKAKEHKKNQKTLSENDWQKFSNLRAELGLPDAPELPTKFMALPREQRIDLIRDCEKKVLIQAGEKEYEFLMGTNKMLAEPQLLNQDLNLEQLKNMMTEYGLQFHIKELPDQMRELHFFAKDANIAARAINRTLETILEEPETVTKPTFEALIKQAQKQTKEKIQEKQEELQTKPGVPSIKEGTKEVAETAQDSLKEISLFDDLKDGMEL